MGVHWALRRAQRQTADSGGAAKLSVWAPAPRMYEPRLRSRQCAALPAARLSNAVLFSWVDTLASATTLLLQFNVIFVCQKNSWNHSKSVSSERIRKRKQTVTNWLDKNDDAVFVSIMWKKKRDFLDLLFSVKSRQKKFVKMTQCPVAYWSTPLTPEDRLRQLPNGKKTFKFFKTCKIRKNWNCRC